MRFFSKNTRIGFHFLLQGIFPTQGSNPCLLYYRWILNLLSDPGSPIILTMWTFVGKMMSLLSNTLSRFVITFLTRSKNLLTSQLQPPSTVILESKKRKSVIDSTFPPYVCCEVLGLDAMIFVFWILSFNPDFSLSSFIVIKRLFNSSLYATVRVVSYVCLGLLIFLQVILILAWDSCNLAFCMI